jgi:DNA-binding HxlR family transcriptional regulator
MKSYGQYCSMARGLDVIGDRWTLLIVRELLSLDSARYSDLLAGLPGISTNLLASRLVELEESGLIERKAPTPPVATALYVLTEHGRALEPVLVEIGKWAVPTIAATDWRENTFRTHWLALPARSFLHDSEPDAPPVRLVIDTGDEPLTLVIGEGRVTARTGDDPAAEARLVGDPAEILRTLVGARPTGSPGAARLNGAASVLTRAGIR